MTFDDILEQVIALLKRQGRVSYGAIRLVQGYFDCEPLGEHDLRGELSPSSYTAFFGKVGCRVDSRSLLRGV
jgi:hypothetical protein